VSQLPDSGCPDFSSGLSPSSYRLSLPENRTRDADRLDNADVPDATRIFQFKPVIAPWPRSIWARTAGLSFGVVLADADYRLSVPSCQGFFMDARYSKASEGLLPRYRHDLLAGPAWATAACAACRRPTRWLPTRCSPRPYGNGEAWGV